MPSRWARSTASFTDGQAEIVGGEEDASGTSSRAVQHYAGGGRPRRLECPSSGGWLVMRRELPECRGCATNMAGTCALEFGLQVTETIRSAEAKGGASSVGSSAAAAVAWHMPRSASTPSPLVFSSWAGRRRAQLLRSATFDRPAGSLRLVRPVSTTIAFDQPILMGRLSHDAWRSRPEKPAGEMGVLVQPASSGFSAVCHGDLAWPSERHGSVARAVHPAPRWRGSATDPRSPVILRDRHPAQATISCRTGQGG